MTCELLRLGSRSRQPEPSPDPAEIKVRPDGSGETVELALANLDRGGRGGVLAPGASSYIEQATARPARTWNPLEGLRVDVNRVDVEELEAWAPSLVVAVGLAAKVRTE